MTKLEPDKKYIFDRDKGIGPAVKYANKRHGKDFPPGSNSKERDIWRRRWTKCYLARVEWQYQNLLKARAKRAEVANGGK